jgi:acyl-CoA reductase-like NAD-dependent aldehyde dehydrogenase
VTGMDVQHILQGTREQISAHSEGIVHLISDESGLCLKDARREVQHVLSVLDYSTHASFLEGQPVDYPWGRLVTIQEPIWGVVAITHFNQPLGQVASKIILAILANTSVLLKPCDKTPLSASGGPFGEWLGS